MDVVFSSRLTGRGMGLRNGRRSTEGEVGGGTVMILCLVCFVFFVLHLLSARGCV